ncbi:MULTISPECIES: PilN domain-containing protein [Pseudoalteromonas]|uniref:Pilus assembly protein PilN n=1 Tax=Pseudoalteromonas amylolytica TaxID=1859457 RepID=A0A1S1MMY6_9GAMM|nr:MULTISPECIES: PilN domain-containing protein [Pseudoalteromonas]MCF6436535.1 PilN domain-containing protein [Pseudoalteromonas sp. MMG022]OHU86120.1 pilus assembly protein PilN [Pseudoalteromonas sp. JW3]OHU89773.1 pilus assembly protein PilN [Pseudoalteromonas amylolytica]
MPHINLLPWRDQRRKESQKKFLTIIAVNIVVVMLILYLIGSFYDSLTAGQQVKNNYLGAEVAKLDSRIVEINDLSQQKENLQRRINLIEELQSNRNLGTQIIDEVVRVVPAGVYLTSLERKENLIKVVGRSESNNRLSQMLRGVESSYLLERPTIQGIVTGEQNSRLLSDFTMHFYVKPFREIDTEARAQ